MNRRVVLFAAVFICLVSPRAAYASSPVIEELVIAALSFLVIIGSALATPVRALFTHSQTQPTPTSLWKALLGISAFEVLFSVLFMIVLFRSGDSAKTFLAPFLFVYLLLATTLNLRLLTTPPPNEALETPA